MHNQRRVLPALLCLLAVLPACTPVTEVRSLDQLGRVDFILRAEPLERDLAGLAAYENRTNALRNEYLA